MNIMPPKDRLPVDIALLGDGTPSEVLYEVVEPIVYTVTTSFGSMLAFASEENASARWIVLAPLNSETLARLKSGGLSVREALTASWMFLALMDPDTDAWKQAWCIEESDLPFDRLPQPGTPLLPEHEPVLTTRAIGTTIKPGLTPASVVAFVASSTRSAVKILVDFVYRQKPDGRPREEIRVLYDLPVRQLAFNSFEIDFGNPTLPLSVLPEAEQDFGRVVSLLRRGLEWAASTRDEPLVADSQEEREAILYAMHILTPPAKGAIETVEVGGAWLCGPPLHLTKFSRSRVSREIRSLTTEQVVFLVGRIGEFDDDKRTFILRETELKEDVKAVISPEGAEKTRKLYTDRVFPVWTVGIFREGRFYAAGVYPPPIPEGLDLNFDDPLFDAVDSTDSSKR